MASDTPANSRHHHRPVTRVVDRVALCMAEAGGKLTAAQIAERLGLTDVHVRNAQCQIRQQLGPQAR